MNKFLKKYFVYFVIVAAILGVSACYKVYLNNNGLNVSVEDEADYDKKDNLQNDDIDDIKDREDELKEGKTIVRVWSNDLNTIPARRYQVKNYNRLNKDNIYIDFGGIGNDYDNLLSLTLSSKNWPDIFEYSSIAQIKTNNIIDLNSAGINLSNIDKDSLVYFNGKPIGTRINEQNVKLVWNKEIFKKAGLNPDISPKTWEDVYEYCKIIKEKLNIVPFEFSLENYEDLQMAIGEPCVSGNDIYTTFWNYKNGEYDFSSAKGILSVYKKMFEEGLIDKNFDQFTKSDIMTDFYSGRTAMFISSFNDKNVFNNVLPLDFDMGISDLPTLERNVEKNYYFITSKRFLVINSNSIEDKSKSEAVKKVYEWLISKEVNNQLVKTDRAMSKLASDYSSNSYLYSEYNNIKKFKYEQYDPTIFVSRDANKTKNLYIEAIKGEKSIEDVIEELNSNYKRYWDFSVKVNKLNSNDYVDNN